MKKHYRLCTNPILCWKDLIVLKKAHARSFFQLIQKLGTTVMVLFVIQGELNFVIITPCIKLRYQSTYWPGERWLNFVLTLGVNDNYIHVAIGGDFEVRRSIIRCCNFGRWWCWERSDWNCPVWKLDDIALCFGLGKVFSFLTTISYTISLKEG